MNTETAPTLPLLKRLNLSALRHAIRHALQSPDDLPLATGGAGRFLAALLAILVCLGCLAVTAAMLTTGFAERLDDNLKGRWTVEIAAPAETNPALQERRVAAAQQWLLSQPGILRADPLPMSVIEKLLTPWFGDTLPKDLPIPNLIDVEITEGTTPPAATLAENLRKTLTGVAITDHNIWLTQLSETIALLKATALGLLFLSAIAIILASAFVASASLSIHRPTVELLHTLGADDERIADRCETFSLRLGLYGGGAGLSLALLMLVPLLSAVRGLDVAVMPGFLGSPWFWVSLGLGIFLVPTLAALVSAQIARWAALRWLRRLP